MAEERCYVCDSTKISHDTSIDAEEELYDQQGIIHEYHCMNCGARISVFEPMDADKTDEGE